MSGIIDYNMPLTSTYLKQMKLRVMNSQEQVSACAEGLNGAMGWGTLILGGCFWEWLVCPSCSGSDQILVLEVGRQHVLDLLAQGKLGCFRVLPGERGRDGVD